MNYLETAYLTGQNDRQTQILSRQIVILAGHCPVTGHYFEPWEQIGNHNQNNKEYIKLQWKQMPVRLTSKFDQKHPSKMWTVQKAIETVRSHSFS